jgi:hypothetical protein
MPSLLFTLTVLSALLFSKEQPKLTGIVQTEAGRPLGGAYVESGQSFTYTDAYGKFTITNPSEVLFVWKDGFKPLAHTMKADEPRLSLALHFEAREMRLQLPSCPSEFAGREETSEAVLIGTDIRTPIPKSLAHKSSGVKFVDAGLEQFLSPDRESEELTYSWHALTSMDVPEERYILGSREWNTRNIANEPYSTDWTGTLKNGRKWRWMHVSAPRLRPAMNPGGTWFYYDVSDETAAQYDRMLAQTCVAR